MIWPFTPWPHFEDKRVVKRFLWLPRWSDENKIVWLETVTSKEIYVLGRWRWLVMIRENGDVLTRYFAGWDMVYGPKQFGIGDDFYDENGFYTGVYDE